MNHSKFKRGFTLIELMLAMTFISVLLIAIALLVIQISAIYNRGMTLRQVSSAGQSVVADIQRSVQASAADIDTSKVDSGRLCLGNYSYIWNSADSNSNQYAGGDDRQIRLVRAVDLGRAYCLDTTKLVDPDTTVELLQVGDRSLALHNLTVIEGKDDSEIGQRLYSFSLLIGTDDVAALAFDAVDIANSSCKPPASAQADLVYCAINNFTFTVRAGSK